MLISIIAVILTLLPGIWLVHTDVKEKEKEEKIKKRARNRISLKAIESRWPFISLLEYYYLKKHLNPYFAKTELSRDDAWQMRRELYREIIKRV